MAEAEEEFSRIANGILFDNKEDYDSRRRQDAEAMADLFYNMYIALIK